MFHVTAHTCSMSLHTHYVMCFLFEQAELHFLYRFTQGTIDCILLITAIATCTVLVCSIHPSIYNQSFSSISGSEAYPVIPSMFQHNISGSMKMFVWNHILCKHYKSTPIVVCAPQGRRRVSNIWVVVVTSMRSCLTTLGHKVKVLAPHIRCGLAVSTIRSEWDRRVPKEIALCRVVGYVRYCGSTAKHAGFAMVSGGGTHVNMFVLFVSCRPLSADKLATVQKPMRPKRPASLNFCCANPAPKLPLIRDYT